MVLDLDGSREGGRDEDGLAQAKLDRPGISMKVGSSPPSLAWGRGIVDEEGWSDELSVGNPSRGMRWRRGL